jgi:hypothetical protein
VSPTAQQKLLGKLVGMMCPPLFGCRTNAELYRVRGWDKNLSWRLLGALPKRSWIKRLRRLGLEVLVPLWRYTASKSEATRSRWQWTWVGDDLVFKKYGEPLSLVGTWWSGQEHRVLSGIGGVNLPPPIVVADSWFSDSKLMCHVATTHQGTFLIEGKSSYVFELPDGRQVKGQDFQQQRDWSWHHSSQIAGARYARLRATSPTYGMVSIIIVDAPGADQFYLMCLATTISAPRLIRAWKRRSWIEHCFRTLKHLLATGACQVHNEDAYYGHLV